jgi:NAD(P)-dependent dehydrogenase (short-subunit alcohol dehydrogenase family)
MWSWFSPSSSTSLSSSSSAWDAVRLLGSKLKESTALIVAPTGSIGHELTSSLWKGEIKKLILACRDIEKGAALADQLRALRADENEGIVITHCNLSSVKSSVEAARAIEGLGLESLDLIIFCQSHSSLEFNQSDDGIESMFQINHVGAAAMTLELLALIQRPKDDEGDEGDNNKKPEETERVEAEEILLEDAAEAAGHSPCQPEEQEPSIDPRPRPRVVFVSCSTHFLSPKLIKIPREAQNHFYRRGRTTPWSWIVLVKGLEAATYFLPVQMLGLSKLATILWATELAKVLKKHVDIVSCHPGLTELGVSKFGGSPDPSTTWRGWAQASLATAGSYLGIFKTVEQAAASIAYAALAPLSDSFASGCYVEDCKVSLPSVEARDEMVAAALWEATDVIIQEAKRKGF